MKLILSILFLFSTCTVRHINIVEIKIEKQPIEFKEIIINLTAYYTPIIYGVKDYGTNGISIKFKRKKLLLYFPKGAVNIIEREGFAICYVDTETLKGKFILDSKFNLQPYIKGSESNRLIKGDCATDNDFIPHNSNIYIPALNLTTKSKDVGGKIKGNDVDLYLGEGSIEKMEKLSYKFTGKFKAKII